MYHSPILVFVEKKRCCWTPNFDSTRQYEKNSLVKGCASGAIKRDPDISQILLDTLSGAPTEAYKRERERLQ